MSYNKIEEKMNSRELGIYIHIPFCKRKCYYCDFISYTNKQNVVKEYIESVIKEIDSYNLKEFKVTTIYIGGGTPSFIDENNIELILNKLKSKIQEKDVKWEEIEKTIEVNPGTVTLKKIETYKKSGINRISIGLQSTKDRLLEKIGRIHTYKDFLTAYEIINQVGIKNVNVDLMLGLPNQTIQDLKESIMKILELNPNHISVYSLILEEDTKLANLVKEGKLELPSEELERKMYWYVKNMIELKGFYQYEISNFSKKGMESKHNLNCWSQKEYIGIGVAAHSYLNNKRYSNLIDIQKYIKNIQSGNIKENYLIHEVQNLEDAKREYMMLGLRKLEGVSITDFKHKYGENPIYLFRKELNRLVKDKLIIVDMDNIRLTNRGLDFANLVFEEFI